jgi:glycosyltransferase involved in cell wall biosynthesis
MKKFLLVLSSGKFSGGEKVALDIAKGLENDFKFIFFLPEKPQKEFSEYLKDFKIYFPEEDKFFSIIKKLQEVINLEKPGLVHSHGIRASIFLKLAILLNFKKTFRFVYTLHGIHFVHRKFPWNFIFLLWEFITNRIFVDNLICVGKDDFDLAKKLKLIKKNKTSLIENGIKIEDYNNLKSGFLRNKFKLKDKKILLTICRLHYPKDIKTLIKAINLIRNSDLILYIIGDGPDRRSLEEMVRKLNLQDKVQLLGFQKEVKELLNDSDIFILSSRWEGLPIVILEAWASKVPVIASNVHGIKGLIQNNKDGLLFEFGNEKDLTEKIKFLLENRELQKQLIENGFSRVQKEYNLDKMVEQYKNLYSFEKNYENSSSK